MKLVALARITLVSSLAVLLAACGGGGGGSANNVPSSTAGSTPPPIPAGPNEFLLFPNPQLQNGVDQTNTLTYAQAYYQAIDPNGQRTTFENFKTINGFYSATPQTVLFDDTHDLGYGRRITFWTNADGSSAAFVENYLAGGFSNYQSGNPQVNLAAGAIQDPRWLVEINAIEYSAAPGSGPKFTKFYVFDAAGNQQFTGTLDNRGPKFMPSVCISCHGGRGDALTPPSPTTGLPLFPLVYNSATQLRGDTGAHMQPVEVGIQVFQPDGQTYSRPPQEAALKDLNKMVLCSYPVSTTTAALNYPEDACRRVATSNEWQGDSAGDFIRAAYGGPGLPSATWNDTYISGDYAQNGQASLYSGAIVTGCRVCHKLRGTGNNSDIDFDTTEKLGGYSDRVYAHVYDRGNMPLALLVYDSFWSSTGPSQLANFIGPYGYNATTSAGVLTPGRPVADPGPDRVASQGTITLSSAMSLYATSFAWTITSNPGNAASLSNASASGSTISFTSTANGDYSVQLVASSGGVESAPATLKIHVDNTITPAPSAVTWADVKNILQNNSPPGGATLCTTCHTPGTTALVPPIFYVASFDRSGTGVAATNDFWLYTEVVGRVNFTDIIASPILRKPSGHHHGGNPIPGTFQTGFDTSQPVGDPARANYDQVVSWILNGAPYQ